MGIYRNIFFSETTELIEPELYMNDDWMVLYKVTVFILVGNSRWLPVCRPSWISEPHKKQKLGKEHSNDHLFTVWVQSVH
jgi:hypothetical protein